MPIADRNGLIDDLWTALADDAPAERGAPIIVSLERLKSEHNSLFSEVSEVGVEVKGDIDLDDLKPFMPQLGIVVVRFDAMKDGRPFSVGRLLRERYGFDKDLRAAGPFIPDQALFLLRCGYTSFDIDESMSLETWKRSIAAYTAFYQRANDKAQTVLDLRHERNVEVADEGGVP
jgi:uncharacterized protein (DUF934 family)